MASDAPKRDVLLFREEINARLLEARDRRDRRVEREQDVLRVLVRGDLSL